jgi:hypothetical protein
MYINLRNPRINVGLMVRTGLGHQLAFVAINGLLVLATKAITVDWTSPRLRRFKRQCVMHRAPKRLAASIKWYGISHGHAVLDSDI